MRNLDKKIVSIIGIVVGLAIVIIGFSLQDTTNYSIGESIRFGADFYTEMYDVTQDVGRAINRAINDLIRAVGWLIVSLGAIDICFFVYKLIQAFGTSAKPNIERIDKNVQILATPAILEAQRKASYEAEERARRAAEEKAAQEAAEHAKRAAEEAEKRRSEEIARKQAQVAEKPLADKLMYALQFQTDEGMVRCLKDIKEDAVQSILESPTHLIRTQIQELLEQLQ